MQTELLSCVGVTVLRTRTKEFDKFAVKSILLKSILLSTNFALFLLQPISMCTVRTDFDVTLRAGCKIKIISR